MEEDTAPDSSQQELLQQQQQAAAHAQAQAAAQAQAQANALAATQQPHLDIAAILQGIQQQLVHLAPMNQRLEVVAKGLETVTNKVAYLEAHQDGSDYYEESEGEENEHGELAAEAGKFFIGENGTTGEEPKGRGRRKGAGNATTILKTVRKR